jgi:hypothetical protein
VDRPEDYERLLASQLLGGSQTNDERGMMNADRELSSGPVPEQFARRLGELGAKD